MLTCVARPYTIAANKHLNLINMTLIDKINSAKSVLAELSKAIHIQKEKIRALELERRHCVHEWDSPYPGYEHEGRTCKLCGINDIHAHTLGYTI